jgi:hypothetical protein
LLTSKVDAKRAGILNNATKDIEGLIQVKAEKIAEEATKNIISQNKVG